MNNQVTIIFVSFFAYKNLKRYLNQFKRKFKVIIIDNSNDKKIFNLKKKNIEIIINKKNIGFGASLNLGLKRVKTKYALHLDLDTKLSNWSIINLIKKAQIIKDFGMLVPRIKNYFYRTNDFYLKNLYKNIHQMKTVDGCCMLFDIQKIKKVGFFDKNFFLYYEETDFQKRLTNNSEKILMYDKALIYHKGRSSSDEKYDFEIELNRNWHYMWSKFYYFKKHWGYFVAIFKTFNHFYSSFFKYFFFKFTMNKKKELIYYCRLSGCWNAMLNKRAWYRPKIKKF